MVTPPPGPSLRTRRGRGPFRRHAPAVVVLGIGLALVTSIALAVERRPMEPASLLSDESSSTAAVPSGGESLTPSVQPDAVARGPESDRGEHLEEELELPTDAAASPGGPPPTPSGPTPGGDPAAAGGPAAPPPAATPEPPAATPAPPAATPSPPPPPPPQSTVASRCPTAMDASPPAGWRRVVTSTFSETRAIGSWPGPVAGQAWKNRARGPDSSGRGTYDSSRTVSEGNGLLDVWVHSEGNTRYVAAPVSRLGGTRGARISVCMRADAIPGYKIAFLLWPTDGQGNSLGEIDFPEGKLDGGGATARAFMHHAGRDSQDAYDSGVALQGWHTYTIEWNPKASTPYVSFFVDGRLLGTSRQDVPTVPMFYVMQIETYLKGQALPPPAAGHVQMDWVTIDLP